LGITALKILHTLFVWENISWVFKPGYLIHCIVFFSTGFCVSAARLGLPDVGLISYGEMVDQGRLINEAVSIPVIGDGDNGYGNSMNIKRTIKGYINAGFAGIMLEDQVRSFRNTNQSFHRLAP